MFYKFVGKLKYSCSESSLLHDHTILIWNLFVASSYKTTFLIICLVFLGWLWLYLWLVKIAHRSRRVWPAKVCKVYPTISHIVGTTVIQRFMHNNVMFFKYLNEDSCIIMWCFFVPKKKVIFFKYLNVVYSFPFLI
jgi:hypothetical protein